MSSVWLLVRKDLRILRRSPLLLAALLAYPIVIAVLVGLVAGYANSKPRVAFVDRDHVPPIVVVAGNRFHIQTIIDEVSQNVDLVRMSAAEARRELDSGKIVASVTVPPGFLKKLTSNLTTPNLVLRTTTGGLAPRVTQQMQSLVYQLNRKLQDAFVKADLAYVTLILSGGHTSLLGRSYDVLGLDRMQQLLAELPPDERVTKMKQFAAFARLALTQTGSALQATANPIGLIEPKQKGRTWVLSAQVQAYGIALTVTFLALLLAAGAAAAERDEGTIGRLGRGSAVPAARGLLRSGARKPAHPGVLGRVRGVGFERVLRPRAAWSSRAGAGGPSRPKPLVSLGQLVWAKVLLAAAVALALGAVIAVVFGIVVQAGGVTGGEPWDRLPLLLAGVLVAGAAVGAAGTLLGALAREARTASLVAVLIVLPVVFLGLVPKGVAAPAVWISDLLPFAHAVRLFGSALYDTSPWRTVGVETAWLVGIGAVFGLLARAGTKRLLG